MAAWMLRVTQGGATSDHPVDGETTVGRGRKCDVRIRDSSCSRLHFMVRPTAEGLELEHAHPPDQNPDGSWLTMRTFVNGEQVPVRVPLQAADLITLTTDPDPTVTVEVLGPS